jgi:multidrug efflux system membrane fusion protein
MRSLALTLGVLLGSATYASAQPAAPPEQGVPVQIAPATTQDVPVYLRGIGTVRASVAVLLRARVDGTLVSVPVTEGQFVHAGDILAIIDPRPYQATLDQALAKKAQDVANLANQRADLARYSTLAKQDFASHQQVDSQQAMVQSQLALIKADDATIEAAQLNLGFCTVRSPTDGRVGLRQLDPGNLIHANDATGIITVARVQPIELVFTLPQDDLPRIAAAMAHGTLPVAALASDTGAVLDQGALLTTDNTIDTGTGTIRLKAAFPNEHNTLWPGQFVDARLQIDVRHGATTVPSSAIQHGQQGLYVYVMKPDSTVTRAPVEVAQDDGTLAVVTNGLSPGTPVVRSGQSRLQDGVKVSVVPPQANATAAAPAASRPVD